MASVAGLVLVCFVVAAVPRDAWFVHHHADDPGGHVHAWGNAERGQAPAAAAADDTGWDELLAESVAHTHAHEDGHPHGHTAQAADPSPQRTASAPALAVAATASWHSHWQAPFQLSARPTSPALEFRPFNILHSTAAASALRTARRFTRHARAPPHVLSA